MASQGLGEEVSPAAAWPSELRAARRSAGLTQGALGKLVNVSAATIGGYELGKWQPPAEVRAALEGLLESNWPGQEQGGVNVSEEQDLEGEEPELEAVEVAEVVAEVAEIEAEVAELAALATLAEELRQQTLDAGRRAGQATAVEAELLLGSGLAAAYRAAFAEGLEDPEG